jgi:glycosyltransferase involved in cell wall biosynthesis
MPKNGTGEIMQNKTEGILRAINNHSGRYNILTFPTHEAYQSSYAKMPHTFYLWQGKGIKTWNHKYRSLPENVVLLDGSENQIKPDMKFDMVLSQNKFGQFQVAKQLATILNLPLLSIEHTLPVPTWSKRQRESMTEMRGNLNVFISEYSVKEWGFSLEDSTVKVIHHGIDTDIFKPSIDKAKNGKILTVVNDWISRDWCCGWSIYSRVSNGLPVNPIGDTQGFSKPAKDVDDLVRHYQQGSVFLNTSTVSPVPTALLEAMACGCPVVTTATCMIPEVVQDGVNGFISNDEGYLRDRLIWCLRNPDEAAKLGEAARETILNRFSLDKHVDAWNNVFKEVYGRPN